MTHSLMRDHDGKLLLFLFATSPGIEADRRSEGNVQAERYLSMRVRLQMENRVRELAHRLI